MFTTLDTVGYKCLREFNMPFEEDFVLLLGPNGSGKSSVLDGLHLVAQLARSWPQKVLTGPRTPSRLRSWGYTGSVELATKGQVGDTTVDLEFKVDPDEFPEHFSLTASDGRGRYKVPPDNSWKRPNSVPFTENTIKQLSRLVRLRLEPRLLADPSYTKADHPRVESNGRGLASSLAHMVLYAPDSFEELQQAISEIVPTFRRLRFEKLSLEEVEYVNEFDPRIGEDLPTRRTRRIPGEGLLLDMSNAEGIPAQHASEGTLLVIGILSVVLREGPQAVLVDDIDRGLHPRACGAFVKQLMQLVTKRHIQVIASAHSPFLVDHVPAQQVRLLSLDDEGATRWMRLSDHRDYDRFRNELSTGEFWSSVGEDWVVERTTDD